MGSQKSWIDAVYAGQLGEAEPAPQRPCRLCGERPARRPEGNTPLEAWCEPCEREAVRRYHGSRMMTEADLEAHYRTLAFLQRSLE